MGTKETAKVAVGIKLSRWYSVAIQRGAINCTRTVHINSVQAARANMMKSDRSWGYPTIRRDRTIAARWPSVGRPLRLDTEFPNCWAKRWEMCTQALSREIKGYKPSSTETICSAKVRDPNDVWETWIYKIHWWIIIALLGWPCEGYIKWGLYKSLTCSLRDSIICCKSLCERHGYHSPFFVHLSFSEHRTASC